MIWIVFCLFILGGGVWLITPLLAPTSDAIDHQAEIQNYKTQIRNLERQIAKNDGDIDSLKSAKTELERRVLKTVRAKEAANGQLSKWWPIGVFGFITLASFAIYTQLGSPNLARNGHPKAAQTPTNLPPIEELVTKLERRLANLPDSAPEKIEGQYMLARTLMRLRRFDEAMRAYDKLQSLDPTNDKIRGEITDAKAYIASQNMANNPQAQKEMITGMVEGLQNRLDENPKDPQGWSRLLRARAVLGQKNELEHNLETMKSVFKDDPQTIQTILDNAGLGQNP